MELKLAPRATSFFHARQRGLLLWVQCDFPLAALDAAAQLLAVSVSREAHPAHEICAVVLGHHAHQLAEHHALGILAAQVRLTGGDNLPALLLEVGDDVLLHANAARQALQLLKEFSRTDRFSRGSIV
jgi:hypothetical protein